MYGQKTKHGWVQASQSLLHSFSLPSESLHISLFSKVRLILAEIRP